MKTLVIGRSPAADIVVADGSVASHHAELIVTDDGRLYLVDCASAGGTWRRTTGEAPGDDDADRWSRVRQTFVVADEPLRLGDYRCTGGALLRAAREAALPDAGTSAGGSAGASQGASRVDGGRQPLRGRVERDAVTGEIVRRRP